MATAKVGNPTYAGVAVIDDDCKRCRMCHSAALRVDWAQGDRVCTNCGVVDEGHLLDDRPEWREFSEDNDLAKNGGSMARSGLVVVDESRYWGGLQPTTLSKHVYGGASMSGSSSSTSKRLVAASRRIDHRMEKLSARSMEAVRLHRKIILKNKMLKTARKQSRNEHGNFDDADDVDDEDEYGGEEGAEEEESSSLRPEYEQLVLQEEEDATRVRAALYADKWSLQRAIQLFGTDHEVSLLQGENDNPSLLGEDSGTTSGSGSSRLDATLKQASQDLYRAYSMLVQSATQLHLPERVKGEAVSLLCRYAARRDGLTVRGVSSTLKNNRAATATAASTSSPRQEKMARSALGDYNKMKQAGALCSALIFYSCRFMGWPRPLEEVCASVKPYPLNHTTSDNQNFLKLFFGDKQQEDQFIKKKHCSRAMSEVKELFPDMAQNADIAAASAASTVTTTAPSLSSTADCGREGAGVVSSLLPSSVSASSSKNRMSMSLTNLVDHKLRSLHLPPVAEAVVRSLVCYWQQQQQQQQQAKSSDTTTTISSTAEPSTNNPSTLCAALTLFVCHVGAVMQRLASQASKSKKRKAAVMMMMSEQQQQQLLKKKAPPPSPETMVTTSITTTEESSSSSSSLSSSSSSTSFDVFDTTITADDLSAEQRAYEMGRVWDAWCEQTPWSRSLAEVEQSCRVSGSSILEFYRKRLYPERGRLLNQLKESVTTSSRISSTGRNKQGTRQGGGGGEVDHTVFASLKSTPLSSVLLTQIHVVSSLLNEDGKVT